MGAGLMMGRNAMVQGPAGQELTPRIPYGLLSQLLRLTNSVAGQSAWQVRVCRTNEHETRHGWHAAA